MTNPLDKLRANSGGAIQVIAQLGYHYATTDKIANQAGIAVGTIYNYFRNKDEILDYIFQVEVDKRYRCYNELASRDLLALEKMRQLLTMHFQVWRIRGRANLVRTDMLAIANGVESKKFIEVFQKNCRVCLTRPQPREDSSWGQNPCGHGSVGAR